MKFKQLFLPLALLMLFVLPHVFAVDFNQDVSDSDKEKFDAMLEPVMKIYTAVKYLATAFGVLLFVFAGIKFMTNGADQGERERAKSTMKYIVIGLVIIWVAPLIVEYIA